MQWTLNMLKFFYKSSNFSQIEYKVLKFTNYFLHQLFNDNFIFLGREPSR